MKQKATPLLSFFTIVLALMFSVGISIPLNAQQVQKSNEQSLFDLLEYTAPSNATNFYRGNLNEGFEGDLFPPQGWRVINGGDANTWVRYTTTPITGAASAAITYGATPHDDWLITPRLAPDADNHSFSFKAKQQSAVYIEKFNVMLSTTSNDVEDFTVTLDFEVGPAGTTPETFTYDLSDFIGQEVYIAIQAISTDEFRLYVDDFVGPPIVLGPPNLVVTGLNKTYSKIPAVLLPASMNLAATVINTGEALTAPTNMNFTVAEAGYSAVAAIQVPFATGDEQTITAPTPWNTSGLSEGIYNLHYEADHAISNAGDRVDNFPFEVTERLYARDNGITAGGVGSNSAALTFGMPFDIPEATVFSGMQVQWPNTTSSNIEFQVAVYEINESFGVISTVVTSETFIKTAEMIGQTIDFAVTDTPLAAGRYMLAVKQLGGDNIGMGYDQTPYGVIYLGNNAASPTAFSINDSFGNLTMRMIINPSDEIVVYPKPRNFSATADGLSAQLTWDAPILNSQMPAGFGAVYSATSPILENQPIAELGDLPRDGEIIEVIPGTKSLATRNVLYDNGPFINGPGQGAGGADISYLHSGMTGYGANINLGVNYSLADDFEVPAVWNVESFTFYGYQTGSPTTSSMTGAYMQIWNGKPDEGGEVIYGDLVTNVMIDTEWTGAYRVSGTALTNTDRPIMSVTAGTPGLVLQPGTYWVEFSLTGSIASGPWGNPITITGETTTGNGMQNVTDGWQDWTDGGTGTQLGVPFLIDGTVGSGTVVNGPLLGYNIYHEGELLTNVGPEALDYLDGPLEGGIHQYQLTAVYGEPYAGESDPVNASVLIIAPAELPFVEGFDMGFENGWTFEPSQGNWSITTANGQPAPAAQFGWSPTATNYSISMISKDIIATDASDVTLAFDLYLNDYANNGNEHMSIHVWNGSAWVEIDTFSNNGSLDWETYTYNITAHAAGKVTKVKFEGHGLTTFDINQWYIDNISVTGEAGPGSDLPAPRNLSANVNAQDVSLSWQAPDFGDGRARMVLSELYLENTAYGTEPISVGSFEQADIAEIGGTAAAVVPGIKHQTGSGLRDLLWDNGPFVNAPGQGAAGADVSHLHSGQTTYGPNVNQGGNYLIADDFEVDAVWEIETFTFYGYQTGSGNNSTFTGGYIQILDAAPDAGGQLVWGDMTTNRMISTSWTNAYRTTETDLTNADRPIMEVVCATPGLVLDPGVYWVVYGLTGSAASGPWMAPVTITGQVNTGNGKQLTPDGWIDLIDDGANGAYGATFLIEGEAGGSGTGDYNLLGYNVYRDSELITTTAPYIRFYLDADVQPGPHTYDVTAVYDEPTPGESDAISIDVYVEEPPVVFFEEPWTSGNFTENQWSFEPAQGNWTISTATGNPAPAAQFGWSPTQTDYSYTLLSTDIDATAAEGYVTFEFDLNLSDYASNGNEHMIISIWNGNNWVELDDIANNGSIPWTTYSYDVTTHALGKITKVKFEATGLTTFDFNYWYIDNIKMMSAGDPGTGEATIAVNPDQLYQEIEQNQTAVQQLTVTNTGEGPLYYELTINTSRDAQQAGSNTAEDYSLLNSRLISEGHGTVVLSKMGERNYNPSPFNTRDEVIRYDNGINDDAIGLTSGGTFQVSAYWPASTMGQYAGMKIEKVEVYINDVPSVGKIKIYGPGTAAAPGTLLYEQVFTSTPDSWVMVELDNEVDITGEDIWIGYEVTHAGGTYPAGCDAGPAVVGFGDMISTDGSAWDPISVLAGFDVNWNIAAHLITGVVYANDVGVQKLLSPETAPELTDEEVVTIRVKNYGTNPQSNINVSYSLDGGPLVMGTINGPVAPGETTDFTFGMTADLSNEGQTYSFHICALVTGDENPSNNCKTVEVTHTIPVYCDASTTNQDEYIARVQCGTIDNSSGWQGGVADYTDQYTQIAAGQSEEIIITNGSPWASDKVTVWVDWNRDYEFGIGTNEQFVLTSVGSGASFVGEIMVPAGTPEGEYRMRIRMTYSVDPTPCGSQSYGEVEDYTIKVGYGTPWISADPMAGVVGPGQSKTIDVTFNSHETPPGTYYGSVVFSSNDLSNPELTVPVTMEVTVNERPMPRNLVGEDLGNAALLSWQAPDFGGGGPGGGEEFHEDFESGTLPAGWVVYDVDGDGHNWHNSSTLTGYPGHSGLYCMLSASYVNNVGALNPDNWLVTPAIKVTADSELKFWVSAQDPAYSNDQYYVRISTTGNAVADFTETIHGALTPQDWTEIVLDLSAYAGQTIYIAFVHADCTDWFYAKIDDVTVTNTESRSAYTAPVASIPTEVLPYREGGSPAVHVANGSSEPLDISLTRGEPAPVVTGIKHQSGTSARSLLFDNGPFVNAPGQGAGGADVSHLHSGQNTYGPNMNQALDYFLADDFVVDETWTIESFTFYSYQTGSTTTSTYTGGYVQILDAAPDAGGQVVWGDLTTNLMASTAWTNAYRTNETALTNTDRPIMQIVCATPGLTLEPGTYWVVFGVTGSGASGPWGVPVTITGQLNTGNAKQLTTTGWVDLEDSGTNTPYGMAFLIEGETGGTGTGEYNLLGYNVYRDGEQIGNTAASVRTYLDDPVEAATYTYGVTAVYGEPHAGESNMITVKVKVTEPVGFPFLETWDGGTFDENGWTTDPDPSHWAVNANEGNPAPAARFYWSPTITNYSHSLISPVVDASDAEENVSLSFDVKLWNYNASSTEQLKIWVWDNDQNDWVLIETFKNSQEMPWSSFTYDITAYALGKPTQVKFEATGATTMDIYDWHVDNIHIYEGEYVPSPIITVNPTSLESSVGLGGTDTKTLTVFNTGEGQLNWSTTIQYTGKDAVQKPVPEGPAPAVTHTLSIGKTVGEPGGEPELPETREDIILHYDGENQGNAIGLTSGGEFNVAARFPTDMVSGYAGFEMKSVDVYINDMPTAFTLYIWGAGTTTSPGSILYEQTLTPTSGWYTITVGSPVILDGSDIWVGYKVAHAADQFPAGCDGGPANPNGDWISTDGTTWEHLSPLGLDYNWNIRATISGSSTAGWLTLNPTTGNVTSGGSATVNAMFDASELGAGSYTANILFNSNDPVTPVVVVPVVFNVAVGVHENSMQAISVYPVPAANMLTIQLVEGVRNIHLLNLLGQTVQRIPISGELIKTVDISALHNGAYTLQFINDSGQTHHIPIIISK